MSSAWRRECTRHRPCRRLKNSKLIAYRVAYSMTSRNCQLVMSQQREPLTGTESERERTRHFLHSACWGIHTGISNKAFLHFLLANVWTRDSLSISGLETGVRKKKKREPKNVIVVIRTGSETRSPYWDILFQKEVPKRWDLPTNLANHP